MEKKKWYVISGDRHFAGEGEIQGDFLHLENAAWIADTGRFSDFIAGADAAEVEPVGSVVIHISRIQAMIPIPHPMPMRKK